MGAWVLIKSTKCCHFVFKGWKHAATGLAWCTANFCCNTEKGFFFLQKKKLFMWSGDAAYVPSKLGFSTLLLSPISWLGGGELTKLAQNECIGGKSNSWTSKAPLFVLFNNYLSILEWTANGVETVIGARWELGDSQPAKTHPESVKYHHQLRQGQHFRGSNPCSEAPAMGVVLDCCPGWYWGHPEWLQDKTSICFLRLVRPWRNKAAEGPLQEQQETPHYALSQTETKIARSFMNPFCRNIPWSIQRKSNLKYKQSIHNHPG